MPGIPDIDNQFRPPSGEEPEFEGPSKPTPGLKPGQFGGQVTIASPSGGVAALGGVSPQVIQVGDWMYPRPPSDSHSGTGLSNPAGKPPDTGRPNYTDDPRGGVPIDIFNTPPEFVGGGPGPDTFNRGPTSPAEQTQVFAGAFSALPIVYGEAWVAGKVFYSSKENLLRVAYVHARGEADSIQKLRIGQNELDVSGETPGNTFSTPTLDGVEQACIYVGTSGQNVSTCTIGPG